MSTNYISQITATDGITYDVQEGVTTRIFRATCSTAPATAAKVATLDDATGYSLAAGVRVAVTFTYGNTATSPTLNVNSGGAKNIYYRTDVSTTQKIDELCVWGASETVIFTYNGSSWIMMGSSLALYNAYNKAASSGSGTITEVKTNAGAHTTIDVLSGKAEFNVPTKTSHLTNDSGFITSYTETDPVFSASAAAGITSTDISNWNAKGSGTVTSVGVSNATNGGLSVSGSPITSNGTITIGHSNILSSAQTTQAVYPIKIDKNGHISSYGSAVTIPTKVSQLTNDSNYVTTDEKVKQTPLNAVNGYRQMIVTTRSLSNETTSTTAFTKNLTYNDYTPTLKIEKNSDSTKYISITGEVIKVNNGSYATKIICDTPTTSDKTITFPNATGTVALTSDIPTVPTKTSDLTNDSGFITSYTDTKNTAGSTESSSKLYLIGATEQSANPQTYSNSNLYYDSINGFYVKSPTDSNSYSCIKQDNYGCTNIYAYSSSDDMPLSTILVSSSEVFLGNRNLEMGYNSSISISDGNIYLSPGANDKHVYMYNLGAPSNDTDAATKKYVDDSIAAIPAASITLNGTSTTSASFYAPTSAGTSGQYLRSNGTGAPSWVTIDKGAQVQIVRW